MTWRTVFDALAILALAAAVLFVAYDHGRQTMNSEWQQRWSDRDAGDKQAWAIAEAAEREKEQAHQQAINKVIQDGQKALDSYAADLAAARIDSRVREQTDKLASTAASKASSHSCTTAASQAAVRAVLVFADVLKRADERAGQLASYADESRIRGLNCEAAYQGIVN